MTAEYIEYPIDNPPPPHVAQVTVPADEWTEAPGFDPTRTVQVRHSVENARLRLLVEYPGKVSWHPTVPSEWWSRVDDHDPTCHSGAVGVKMTFGEGPDQTHPSGE